MQQNVRVIKKTATPVSQVTEERKRIKVAAYCRVSTDDDEQLLSFNSQKAYYKDKIESNPEWNLVELYADEAITGTKVDVREGFQRMINDAMNGRIDIIMTKSISRFARNTVDTLNYVRKLKEKRVAVIFEEENINTLTMDGELLLTILSSVAQQEVQNVSEHVKAGLKMKLQRGEMIGFNGCYGYDYDSKTKSMSINSEQAKIVRFIFDRYAAGYGASSISKELFAMGVKTARGSDRWATTTITDIIRNEKYYGDAIFGKSYTIDPISKKRVVNRGASDIYQFENHHEPIVTKEVWEKANQMLNQRADIHKGNHTKLDFNGKYCMSFKIKCGCCGKGYHRRSHQQNRTEFKSVWKCSSQTKLGRTYCPNSRVFDEIALEQGFIHSLKTLIELDGNLFDSFISTASDVLNTTDSKLKVTNAERSIAALRDRQKKLVDLMLDGSVSRDDYNIKSADIAQKIAEKEKEIKSVENMVLSQKAIKDKLEEMRQKLLDIDSIITFDSEVFNETIDRVIIGGLEENGSFNPDLVTYVFDMSNDYIPADSKEYMVLGRIEVDYDYWTYELKPDGSRDRRLNHSFPVQVALKCK